MALLQPQIYSFSQWHKIHEGLNFLTTDIALVEDEFRLATSGRRCFRFLDGSDRKSPRFRAKEGDCVILQYLGGRRYLARTIRSSSTTRSASCCYHGDVNRCNRKDRESRDHFKFLVLDDSLSYPEHIDVIFEWTLSSDGQWDRRSTQMTDTGSTYTRLGSSDASVPHDASRTSEVVFVSRPIAHFESYISCRKRFVVVVGPPSLNCTQTQQEEEEEKEEEDFCQPSNCIFDTEDLSMKVFRLSHSQLGSGGQRWSANVAFDPRPSRQHVAAIVACAETFSYLPRYGQTGSLLIVDVLRQRVLNSRQDRLYHSAHLQYTCTGEQLLTSVSQNDVIAARSMTSLSGDEIGCKGRPSHFALLSSDDLTLLQLLSLSPTSTHIVSSLLSHDFGNFSVFLRISNDVVDSSQSSSLDTRWPMIKVVNFSFPAEVRSLFHLCLCVVRKLVPRKDMIDSLPIPKVFANRLKKRYKMPIN